MCTDTRTALPTVRIRFQPNSDRAVEPAVADSSVCGTQERKVNTEGNLCLKSQLGSHSSPLLVVRDFVLDFTWPVRELSFPPLSTLIAVVGRPVVYCACSSLIYFYGWEG